MSARAETLQSLFAAGASSSPAVVHAEGGRVLSYEELGEAVVSISIRTNAWS
jgi:hypothetical protein